MRKGIGQVLLVVILASLGAYSVLTARGPTYFLLAGRWDYVLIVSGLIVSLPVYRIAKHIEGQSVSLAKLTLVIVTGSAMFGFAVMVVFSPGFALGGRGLFSGVILLATIAIPWLVSAAFYKRILNTSFDNGFVVTLVAGVVVFFTSVALVSAPFALTHVDTEKERSPISLKASSMTGIPGGDNTCKEDFLLTLTLENEGRYVDSIVSINMADSRSITVSGSNSSSIPRMPEQVNSYYCVDGSYAPGQTVFFTLRMASGPILPAAVRIE